MKKQNGITMVALVVTIIVLIILAGVSINMLVGDNGIITNAKEAGEKQKIAELAEKLELEKAPVAIEHRGEVLIADYLEHLKEEGIATDENIETINELQYYITLSEKYVFLAEEINNRDVKITYMGEPGEIPPRITNLAIESTSNQISVQAEGLRLDNGEYTYFIKREKEEEYGESVASNNTGTYTYEDLEQNHIYYIKVEIKTPYGTASKEATKTTETIVGLNDENTTFTITPNGWTNGIVKTKVDCTVSGYTLQYSKDLKEWNNYTQEIESNQNETIYVRLTDGKNIGEFTSKEITNIDKAIPEVANIVLNGAGTVTSNPTVQATITHTDKDSGVEIVNSKWVYNQSGSEIGTDESKYTGGNFNSNAQTLTLAMSQEGTYYLHVLTIDKAGNKKETISKPIKLAANRHQHTGSPTTGGGCYTKEIRHTHSTSCYKTCTIIYSGCKTAVEKNDDQIRCTYTITHRNCGEPERESSRWHADDGNSHVNNDTTSTHQYLVCNQGTGIIGYDLGCGKDGTTIESYTISY